MWLLLAKLVGWLFGLLTRKPAGPSLEAVQAANAAESRTVAQVDQHSAETEALVAEAQAQAPKTQAEVVDSLNRGVF